MVRFERSTGIRVLARRSANWDSGRGVAGSEVTWTVYRELDRHGLKTFRRVCYLTDEWGSPDQQPVLGVPFYLADPTLRSLGRAVDTLESNARS